MAQIVLTNVSVQTAATPNTLQQRGALISQGATNLPVGTSKLLTQVSDLAGIVAGGIPIASMVWSAGFVTVTVGTPQAWTVGDSFLVSILGCAPNGYNGVGIVATINSTTSFSYSLQTNPGSLATPGTVTAEDVQELTGMVNTYFAQGTNIGASVLELGFGNATDGVTALAAYLTANPNTSAYKNQKCFYSYLLPRTWGLAANAGLVALGKNYTNPKAMTYFHVTTDINNFQQFTTIKSFLLSAESPNVVNNEIYQVVPIEFSAAAKFALTLSKNPSATSLVGPFRNNYVYGVTPYLTGTTNTNGSNQAIQTLEAAGVDYITNAAEGGLTNTMLNSGQTADLNDFSYWYGVDYVQISSDTAIANAIINGANNALAPLYFDQNGIDTLTAVVKRNMANCVAFGLVNTSVPPVVNAIPFNTFITQNPGNYKTGQYTGLSVTFVPSRGFTQITFNILVTDFLNS